MIYITDLALYVLALTMVNNSPMKDKMYVFNHHKVAIENNMNRYPFAKIIVNDENEIKKYVNGNIRDYASINELICLSNLENLNSVFINDGLNQSERLVRLNKIAISQMKILNKTDIKYINNK